MSAFHNLYGLVPNLAFLWAVRPGNGAYASGTDTGQWPLNWLPGGNVTMVQFLFYLSPARL